MTDINENDETLLEGAQNEPIEEHPVTKQDVKLSEDEIQPEQGVTDVIVTNEPTGEGTPQKDAEPGTVYSLEEDLGALILNEPELRDALLGAINEKRYLELRALGLTAREAYLASGAPRGKDNRAHLVSAVPHRASSPGTGMSSCEMELARSLFDGLPESEIKRLYSKVTR